MACHPITADALPSRSQTDGSVETSLRNFLCQAPCRRHAKPGPGTRPSNGARPVGKTPPVPECTLGRIGERKRWRRKCEEFARVQEQGGPDQVPTRRSYVPSPATVDFHSNFGVSLPAESLLSRESTNNVLLHSLNSPCNRLLPGKLCFSMLVDDVLGNVVPWACLGRRMPTALHVANPKQIQIDAAEM